MVYRVKNISRFTKKEIDTLFKSSKRVVSHPLLYILKGPRKDEHGRILIVTSKKVGSAPERNKFRRRVKAIFYEDKLFEKYHDLIVIAKPGVTQITFDELKTLLTRAISS